VPLLPFSAQPVAAGVTLRRVEFFDRFRRKHGASPHAPVVRTAVLQDKVSWSQPFHWGLLLAFDNDGDWELPGGLREGEVSASGTCLAAPVLHAQDVEVDETDDPDALLPEALVEVLVVHGVLTDPADFVGVLECPSGQLQVGDADEYRIIQVPEGDLDVEVRLEPKEHAERVVIALHSRG